MKIETHPESTCTLTLETTLEMQTTQEQPQPTEE
jgi:hypothetical protein